MAVHPDVAALLSTVGVEPVGEVALSADASPVLPTAIPLGRAAASVFGSVGAIAARLHHLRTGESQDVSLRVDHAALSMSPDIVLDGQDGAAMRAGTAAGIPDAEKRYNALRLALMGVFQCGDGRSVFLHGSFNPDVCVRFLGLPEAFGRAEIAERIALWDSHELEEAAAEQNLCCNVIRSFDEWVRTAPGAALADTPVIEIVKVASGPPVPFPPSADGGSRQRPLSGVRCLDLARVLAGPMCARTFAEHGADVLKVANKDLPDMRPFQIETGQGKRCCHLDIKTAAGSAKLRELVGTADIFSQNFRVGGLDAAGFGVDACRQMRLDAGQPEGLVYISMNAFGHDHAWEGRGGWEQMAQTVSGCLVRSKQNDMTCSSCWIQ